MSDSSLGSKGLLITDSTGKIIFAARLAGVEVSSDEDMLILQCGSISVINARTVEHGSEVTEVSPQLELDLQISPTKNEDTEQSSSAQMA